MTVEQHDLALMEANRVRFSRAAAKRDIGRMSKREGQEAVARILLGNDQVWASARLDYILKMPRKVGPVAIERLTESCGVTGNARLRDLSGRERLALAAQLDLDLATRVILGEI